MKQSGFTLLEVMVAVAILGLGLTAILSAQAGAFSAAAHARNLSVATSLARCKMGEIEEDLVKDGFQELEVSESGPCCAGDETPNLHCSWKVEKPQFPEPKYGEMNLDTGLDLGTAPKAGGAAGPAGGLGALGGLLGMPGATEVPPPSGDSAGGLGDIAGAIGGVAGADALSGVLGMVGTFVYPILKSIFETNTRRITLTVIWTEGTKEFSFDVTQWVINQKPSLPTNELVDAAQSGGLPGGLGGPNLGLPTGGTGIGPRGTGGLPASR